MAMPPQRATLIDVAREAGVSLATVDRVLNKRSGVHVRTQTLVVDAVARLNYRVDPAAARLARPRLHCVCFVLPSGTNTFVTMLREQVTANTPWLADHRMWAEVVEVNAFEPAALAAQLEALIGRCDTAVVMGMDHPRVRAAVDAALPRFARERDAGNEFDRGGHLRADPDRPCSCGLHQP